VVREIREEEVKWANPTFLVPKAKTGKFRKILDCRALNQELKTTHFKMDSPESVRTLIQEGDWATSLDVKSAFNHVPVHPSLRPYLAFAYGGRFYTYWGMPFGVQHAPRVFTKLMRRAIQAARERWGVKMVAYMDDILLLFNDQETARTQTQEIAAFLQRLGWTLSEEKCEMEPTQEIAFLGWKWNLMNATVTMPAARRNELLDAVEHWRGYAERRQRRPTRELAGLIGTLNFLRLQFPEASLHLRTLDTLKVQAVASGGWDGYCTPNPALRGDLLWWSSSLIANPPKELTYPPPTATMTTDASPVGWGAVLEKGDARQRAFGIWKGEQTHLSSNAKELSAVHRGLQYFVRQGALERNTTLLIRSDNTATVGDINRLSATTTLMEHLKKLHTIEEKFRIHLQAVHLPGVQNEEADRLSRLGRTREYYLKEEAFNEVVRVLGLQPEEDAFATTPYLRSDITVEHPRDALRTPWRGKKLYLHPPLHLVMKTIAKAIKEEVKAILIVPDWKAQPWSPMLRQVEGKGKELGTFEEAMMLTERFKSEGWRLPPGNVRAVILATRTTRGSASCEGF
jgi:ribonuclease HI